MTTRRLTKLLGRDRARSYPGLHVERWVESLSIGNDVQIGSAVTVAGEGSVVIGNDVTIGDRVTISTTLYGGARRGRGQNQMLSIGDGARIGNDVALSPGAVIGEGCVIEDGSMVMGTCEPGARYAGVPAAAIVGEEDALVPSA